MGVNQINGERSELGLQGCRELFLGERKECRGRCGGRRRKGPLILFWLSTFDLAL